MMKQSRIMFVIQLINYDKVNHQHFLGKGLFRFRLNSFNEYVFFRLRYFRDKPTVSIRRDGSSHYQHLRFYPVDDNPPSTTSNTVHFASTVKS
jgi:hypothetical protein